MSSSKSPSGPDTPSDSSLPPTYDSLYEPSSSHLPSPDSKQPIPSPSTTLGSLRTLIAANRSSTTSPASQRRRALLAAMSRTTTAFVATYSTTTALSARLSFVSPHLAPSSSELLAVVPADEFAQTERLGTDQCWADEAAARALATDLQKELEAGLGDFDTTRRETGVAMGVRAEEQTWRCENRFGVYETSTGWAVVVRLRIDM